MLDPNLICSSSAMHYWYSGLVCGRNDKICKYWIFLSRYTCTTCHFSATVINWLVLNLKADMGEPWNHKTGTTPHNKLLLYRTIKPLLFPIVHKDNARGYHFTAIVSPCSEAGGESEWLHQCRSYFFFFLQINRTFPPSVMTNIPLCLSRFSLPHQRKVGHEGHNE